ncbi:MAG: PrpF domain-containing protein [Pseudoclavibacter sp.]
MTDADGIPCLLMRGGTSKGAFFLPEDLPADADARDDLLLRIMGTPDARQIDGIGGATTLTSKVAIVSPSAEAGIDLDYLFLQLGVDKPTVSTMQTCGNILAGVGPFGVERGLVVPSPDASETTIRIRLINTGDVATARLQTPGGRITYDGDAVIDGVPGSGAPVELTVERASPLLPTGRAVDEIEVGGGEIDRGEVGALRERVTLIDNGMPVALLRADDLGIDGAESPDELEANAELVARIERLRLAVGERFGLGDVTEQSVPKMIIVSPPRGDGEITVRAFIPHRVHTSIGVLMAASVAAAVRIPGTVAAEVAAGAAAEDSGGDAGDCVVEHPAGTLATNVTVATDASGVWRGASTSTRTARKLFDGRVFARATHTD